MPGLENHAEKSMTATLSDNGNQRLEIAFGIEDESVRRFSFN